MYSHEHEYEITPDYSIQGECFGFYIINGCIGVQVEDDGTWFNCVGPFLLSRSNELIEAVETLIKTCIDKEVNIDKALPPFEVGVRGTSFCIGISDEYLTEIEEEYRDTYDYPNEDILLEFTPGTRGDIHWIKELATILPSFKVLIENIQV